MGKVELYRQAFMSFKELCAKGRQPSTFRAYCRANGVDSGQMRRVLKNEYQNVRTLMGYSSMKSRIYMDIYERFKKLCGDGKQPGSFYSYCRSFGVSPEKMHWYMKDHGLRVLGLPGYVHPCGAGKKRYKEVPFEDVIFEEAGFLPAINDSVITVRVDGRVAVSFPAETDVSSVAKFIRKIGKEACRVES